MHSDSCARIHMPLYCASSPELTDEECGAIQRERSMAPILCGTAHRSAIYGSCGAGLLAIQPPKAAVGGLRNVIAPKTFRRAQVLCPRSDPADSTAQETHRRRQSGRERARIATASKTSRAFPARSCAEVLCWSLRKLRRSRRATPMASWRSICRSRRESKLNVLPSRSTEGLRRGIARCRGFSDLGRMVPTVQHCIHPIAFDQ